MTARVATAVVGLPLVLVAAWLGSPFLSALVALAAAVAAVELCNIAQARGARPGVWLAVVFAVVLVGAAELASDDTPVVRVISPIVIVAAVALLASPFPEWNKVGIGRVLRGLGPRLDGAAVTTGSALYAGGLLAHSLLLRDLDYGREWLLLLLAATFAADSAAFLVGKAVGSRPLAPAISPNKTWEGAVGGVLGSLVVTVAAFYVLDIPSAGWEPYVLGTVLGVAGQAGDLLISRLKRLGGVDDSGWIVPGHGGILDRLDSIVPNLVVVYHFAL